VGDQRLAVRRLGAKRRSPLMTRASSLRATALAEGETVLRKSSVGHNWVWYYRAAGEAHIEVRNWPEADRCADQILAVTSAEPLPLVEFIAARIKAHAGL
jgi:hypothetical protein